MDKFYIGRRMSYDGALCTVRCKADHIPGTTGEWLGVEWDDRSRGKHNGTLHGVKYFKCRSIFLKIASFVRPARKSDPERTVLEAIRYKYAAGDSHEKLRETVVISGKVAEEVGFDKIIKEQGTLSNIKIVILDAMTINGIAPRNASPSVVRQAQHELLTTCPNVTDLDLSHNPIERWSDIEDICNALPKLRSLKINSVRLRDLKSGIHDSSQTCFKNVRELHLNHCLLNPSEVLEIIQTANGPRFPALQSLWLSQNELSDFDLAGRVAYPPCTMVTTLVLEDNDFTNLDSTVSIMSAFPQVTTLSFQSNEIEEFGTRLSKLSQQFPKLTNLNLSRNQIVSPYFIDVLSQVFPKLATLQVSNNPVYDIFGFNRGSTRLADASFYLTLARIPTLKTLNYTEITPRGREEGEIYYLSVVEKDIQATLAQLSDKTATEASAAISNLTRRYPRYEILCGQHDRDNLIARFTSAAETGDTSNTALSQGTIQQSYPPGSIASRLVTATFHLPEQGTANSAVSHENNDDSNTTGPPPSFTQPIPNTIPTSSLYSLISRKLRLPPLSFKLVYESEELDPVRDDWTTRSQIHADPKKSATRWDDWGDWDADTLVEQSLVEGGDGAAAATAASGEHASDEEKWTGDGVLLRGGRKWRRREVEMLFGMRSWGDWLESGVKACRIRVEPMTTY